MRIDKLLAKTGYGTRKEVNQLLAQKKVEVNQQVITKASYLLNLSQDVISIKTDGLTARNYQYLILNKPPGYICAHGTYRYPTVFNLLQEPLTDLFTVGRLDVDTTGLLLLSNDGRFAEQVISGKNEVSKTYLVDLAKPFEQRFLPIVQQGMILNQSERLKPAEIKLISDQQIELTISEGKYHQVKRMMLACENEVVALKRIRIGALLLPADLTIGQSRSLTHSEKELIFQ